MTLTELLPHVPAVGDALGRLAPWLAATLIVTVAAVVIWQR